jgi:hypothetical protein
VHGITYKYAPQTFANTWVRNNERNTGHTLRNDDDYLLPHPRVEFLKKIPMYSLAAAWNAAGLLRFYQNKTTFKIALKDHLLNEIDDS